MAIEQLSELALAPELRYELVPVGLIDPSPYQPRRIFDDGALMELAENIAAYGLLQPLTVRAPVDGRYQLIAGERRLRALMLAGIGDAPASIRNVTDEEAQVLALAENLQRVDLNPVEEAHAIRAFRKVLGWKVGQIAEKMGKSPSYVETAIRLCTLPDSTLELLREGKLSRSQGDALTKYAEFPAAPTIGEYAAEWKLPAAQLSGQHFDHQWGLTSELQKQDAIRSIYDAHFDRSVCDQCPFGARFGRWCLQPTHFDALQGEVLTEADRELKEKLEQAAAAGVQLVDISLMPFDSYRRFYETTTVPEGCGPNCECRAKALDRQGAVTDICTDPKRFEKLEKAGARALAKQRREYGAEQVAIMEQWFDELAATLQTDAPTTDNLSQVMGVIVAKLLAGGYQSSAAREAAKPARRWLPDLSDAVFDASRFDDQIPRFGTQPSWRLTLFAAEWSARVQIHEHYVERVGSSPVIADWLVWGIKPAGIGEFQRRRYELGKSPIEMTVNLERLREETTGRPPAGKPFEQIAGEPAEAVALRLRALYAAWDRGGEMPESILIAARLLRDHADLTTIDPVAATMVRNLLADVRRAWA